MPNVHFSFRRGAGDVPEILYGKVEIKPTLAFARGTSLVLPAPTTLDLVNGEATANNVYPTPAPVEGQVEWAYRVKAVDTRGQSFEWMVGVPDSTGTVEFASLPRYFETKPPLFGKGEKGDPGEAAKITIGTTTSGATPSVTNSGTNQNAILDFVLPKGDKGDTGTGVPEGGEVGQLIRRTLSGTEWVDPTEATPSATSESPGLVPAGDYPRILGFEALGSRNLDTVTDPGKYNNIVIANTSTTNNYPFEGASAELEVTPYGTTTNTVSQEVTRVASGERWYRRTSNGGETWTEWTKYAMDADIPLGITPSQRIIDLAIADGWTAVYDPSNLSTVEIDSEGGVISVEDSLGLSPTFYTDSTVKPSLQEEPHTTLHGGTMLAQGEFNLTASYGVMQVIETPYVPSGSTNQYVLSGNGADKRMSFSINGSTGMTRFGNGVVLYGSRNNVPGIHLWEAKVDGSSSEFTQDGHYGYRGTVGSGALGVPDSFRWGGFGLVSGSPTNAWQGRYGLFLVHPEPSIEVMNRMRELVMGMLNIPVTSPNYWPEVRSITLDSEDNVVVCKGDPDLIMGSSIMSITKTITCLTARQFLTSDALLDQTFELVADDAFYWGTESVFQQGDTVSFRDLMYAAALPSNDLAPRAIARRVAELYIPGDAPPVKRFLGVLNQNLADWGYRGANASAVGGGGKLSLRQTADVMRRMSDDPVLRGIFGTRNYSLSIGGPNARTANIRHTIDAGTEASYPFGEFIAGKTGSGRGRQHVAAVWQHPTKGEYITVVLGVFESEASHNRYQEMYKGIQAARNDSQNIELVTSSQSGVPVNSTSTLDVTELFTGMTRTTFGDSGVYLIRTGTSVTISFYHVSVASANYSRLSFIPSGFTPQMSLFGTVVDQESGEACYVRVSDQGSVQVGNPPNAIIRGSITYTVMPTDDFPQPPFPGFVWQRV